MDCQTARDRLAPWLDEELSPGEHALVSEHLELCPPCADVAGQLAEQGPLLATLRPPPDPRLQSPDFWQPLESAMEAEWQHQLAEQQQAAAPPAPAVPRQFRVSPVGLLAYAAALALAVAWGWFNLHEAHVAQAQVEELGRALERERRLASQPAAPVRVEAIQPVAYTPTRSTF